MGKKMIFVGLLHYPIYNKRMDVITTSITNLDIHDIARSSRTYGVGKYFIIHPLESQQKLVTEVLDYWTEGFGSTYNPDRKEAFSRVQLVDSMEQACREIEAITGKRPKIVTTDARTYPNTITYKDLRKDIADGETPYLVMFGTGWGIEKETMQATDYILEPIYGPGEYNHLSVRSAVAIILDRLLGENWYE